MPDAPSIAATAGDQYVLQLDARSDRQQAIGIDHTVDQGRVGSNPHGIVAAASTDAISATTVSVIVLTACAGTMNEVTLTSARTSLKSPSYESALCAPSVRRKWIGCRFVLLRHIRTALFTEGTVGAL